MFVWYEQGGDGATKIRDFDLHGSIVEFEELRICHSISDQILFSFFL